MYRDARPGVSLCNACKNLDRRGITLEEERRECRLRGSPSGPGKFRRSCAVFVSVAAEESRFSVSFIYGDDGADTDAAVCRADPRINSGPRAFFLGWNQRGWKERYGGRSNESLIACGEKSRCLAVVSGARLSSGGTSYPFCRCGFTTLAQFPV